MDRLQQQLAFVVEIDKLKNVLRQTTLTDSSRKENTAEHTWHLAMCAVVLAEYAASGVDLNRVLRMILVHDIVEIDAGDTFAFDTNANTSKAEREQRAAERIFSLLPSEQAKEFRLLWEEFEGVGTADSQFANALDRLQPFLQNRATGGGTWRIHSVTRSQVMKRMDPIRQYLPKVWPEVIGFVEAACAKGWVKPDEAAAR